MRITLIALAALCALACASCIATNGVVYAVHLGDGCRDPQTTYTRDHVGDMDAFGGAHFVMDDAPEAAQARATVTVDCGPTSSGAPGELNLDTDTVTIDPAQVEGELAWMAVLFHEVGGHWQIHHGPHPERAKVHACQSPTDLGDPALCDTRHYTPFMVMVAYQSGIGRGNGNWNGDTETADAAPHSQITLEDSEFVQAQLAP